MNDNGGLTIVQGGNSISQIRGENLTINNKGDISLDADGDDIFMKAADLKFGSLTNNSGNLIIKSGETPALTFSGANVELRGNLNINKV